MEGSGVCTIEPEAWNSRRALLWGGFEAYALPRHVWLGWTVCYQTLHCGANSQHQKNTQKKQGLTQKTVCGPPLECRLTSSIRLVNRCKKIFQGAYPDSLVQLSVVCLFNNCGSVDRVLALCGLPRFDLWYPIPSPEHLQEWHLNTETPE